MIVVCLSLFAYGDNRCRLLRRYGLVQCYEAKGDKVNAKLWAQRAVEVKVISKADAEIDQKLHHYVK
jgi:hypothetical protein